MSAWESMAEFYRERAIFWAEQQRQWRETKEFCHQKALEIRDIRDEMIWKRQSTN